MGQVYEAITLKNAGDKIRVECGFMKDPEIRQTTVRAMVDTGAITLVITEGVREQLGLTVTETSEATLANNQKERCQITEPVEVHWKDRVTACPALVIPGDGEVLLGAIPLEGMDLMVNPVDQKLVGVHGDKPVYLVK
jgi:clan AA aspartic protease